MQFTSNPLFDISHLFRVHESICNLPVASLMDTPAFKALITPAFAACEGFMVGLA